MSINTGIKIYTILKERRLDTGEFTGRTKPNVETDPDYVAPVTDTNFCPLPIIPPVVYNAKWIGEEETATCEINFNTNDIGFLVIDINNLPSQANILLEVDNSTGTNINDLVYSSNNFSPYGVSVQNNWMIASDYINTVNLTYRFIINIKKFIEEYPDLNEFKFNLKGRSTSSVTVTGNYQTKSASQGEMIMTGNIGSYVPSIQNQLNISQINTNYIISDGANGIYNTTLPLINKFVYDKISNTITKL